jgi:hypothetical protein
MDSGPHDSLLSRLKRGLRSPAAPDPADQGTAYGMELWLGLKPRIREQAVKDSRWFERLLPKRPPRQETSR